MGQEREVDGAGLRWFERSKIMERNAHRRGVEIKISCDKLSQPLRSRMAWCALGNAPWGSVLKKTRVHARMKFSWNILW